MAPSSSSFRCRVAGSVVLSAMLLSGWVTLSALSSLDESGKARLPSPLPSLVAGYAGMQDAIARFSVGDSWFWRSLHAEGTEALVGQGGPGRRLLGVFDFFTEEEVETDPFYDLEWVQIVPGTTQEYYDDEVFEPDVRYDHIFLDIPLQMRDHIGVESLFLQGGWNGGPLSDIWYFRPGMLNTSGGSIVSGRADEPENLKCDENGKCNRWFQFPVAVHTPTCTNTSGLFAACADIVVSDANGTAALQLALDPVRRSRHAASLMYRDVGRTMETGMVVMFGGRHSKAYVDSLWTHDLNDHVWRPISDLNGWKQEADFRNHAVSASFAAAAGQPYVQEFPGKRVGFLMTNGFATSSAIVAKGSSNRVVDSDTMTDGERVNFEIDRSQRLDTIKRANNLPLTTTLDQLLNASLISFPDLYFKSVLVDTVSDELCSEDGCEKQYFLLTRDILRILLPPNTTMTYSITNTRFGAAFLTVNRTLTGHIVYNTTGNYTEKAVQTNRYERVDLVTSGVTRSVMFGGWNGTSFLNDVWEFQTAVQLSEYQWDQSILPRVTMDSPSIGANYDETVHTEFPLPPLKNTWKKISPTLANGTEPDGRTDTHGATMGTPGGVGADRYTLLVFGGRGEKDVLSDTWELLLEPYPPPQNEVQQIACSLASGSMRAFVPYLDASGRRVLGSPTATLFPNSTLAEWASAFEALPQVATATVHRTDVGRPSDVYKDRNGVAWSPEIADVVDNALTNGLRSRSDVGFCPDTATAGVFTNITIFPPVNADGTLNDTAAYFPVILEQESGDVILGSTPTPLRLPTLTQYTWIPVNTNNSAPPPRAGGAAVALQQAGRANASKAVMVYGGWDGIAPRSDVWVFEPGAAPGEGAWTRMDVLDGGGKWLHCREYALPVELHGVKCVNQSTSLNLARYRQAAARVTTTIDGNGTTTEGFMTLFGVGNRRLARTKNADEYGWNGQGGADTGHVLVCHGTPTGVCSGPITLSPGSVLRISHLVVAAALALAAFQGIVVR